MKNLFAALVVILAASAPSANADSTSIMKEIIAVSDKYKLCLTLHISANTDKFGLPLQFEVDSEFYSRSNRNMYFERIYEKFLQDLDAAGANELSDDESNYLAQKLEEEGFQIGVELGSKFTIRGASAWDAPIRKCVVDFDLKG